MPRFLSEIRPTEFNYPIAIDRRQEAWQQISVHHAVPFAIAVLAKPDRLARPPQPPPPRRRRPPNRSGQKEFGKKKSAAARPKARAGSAAALARARKSPKAG
jgi:hypothetical protein